MAIAMVHPSSVPIQAMTMNPMKPHIFSPIPLSRSPRYWEKKRIVRGVPPKVPLGYKHLHATPFRQRSLAIDSQLQYDAGDAS